MVDVDGLIRNVVCMDNSACQYLTYTLWVSHLLESLCSM